MGKRIKKVRSFTVEGNSYEELARIFKESGTDVSLSNFVSKCLKELSILLKDVERARKEKGFDVPMAYVIKSIVGRNDLFGFYGGLPPELVDVQNLDAMLDLWEYEYEASHQKVPAEFLPFIKRGSHILAPNRKYLIDKKTGRKVVPISNHKLVDVDEK
jgi:hypothetical protein